MFRRLVLEIVAPESTGLFKKYHDTLCCPSKLLRKHCFQFLFGTLINKSYLILPRIQHKDVLLVLRTVFAVGFWLLSFLQLKLWARIPLQIGDSPSAVFLYLCVNFHKCVSVAFYGWIWPAICAASSTVTIDFKLADIKLESSVAYLPKLEKNAVLNMCRYLKRFYTWKKINSIFLKFERKKKSRKSVKSFLPKKPIQKHNQTANK